MLRTASQNNQKQWSSRNDDGGGIPRRCVLQQTKPFSLFRARSQTLLFPGLNHSSTHNHHRDVVPSSIYSLPRSLRLSCFARQIQTCNIAFVKTHKTASTTAATIFYRYGKRHGLNVANFDGHQSSIELPDAVKEVRAETKKVGRYCSKEGRGGWTGWR